jgi:hypothetical protein
MRSRALAGAAAAVVAIGVPVAAVSAHTGHHHHRGVHRLDRFGHRISHVMLISVDGLHQSDLTWYVNTHPGSTLAQLTRHGAEYSNAQTPVPSDSDPGMTAQMTGGDPGTTGVYYDVEYNHDVFSPGTTNCSGPAPGGDVIYDSPDDIDDTSLDAGEGLSGLPGSILQMTSHPENLLVPSTFPVDPTTCKPIGPNQYLKVNTIMEVAHQHGLVTAWSDKHPVYTSFDGPSGTGITDSFDPEIDSNAVHPDGTPYPNGDAWTDDNAATMQYDSYKVQAVLNWIDGYNHQRTQRIGTPAIFGMNFQTVSTAEKLPTSDGLQGGYTVNPDGSITPGPLLQRALGYVNDRVGRMVDELRAQHLEHSTAIVISAKHGQSPMDPRQLTRIDDGPIIDGVNAAWDAAHPGAGPLVVAGTDDDAVMWWLSDRSQAAANFAASYLMSHSATGNTITGSSRTLPSSGLVKVYAGAAAAQYFHVPVSDPRHPDVWGVVQQGVVYTGGTKKIAEHGGANGPDRDVPILIDAPHAIDPGSYSSSVETTQIAPTVLQLLGLDPDQLQAVQIEHTHVLPGIGR